MHEQVLKNRETGSWRGTGRQKRGRGPRPEPEELAGNAAAKTYTYHMGLQYFAADAASRPAALKCAQQARRLGPFFSGGFWRGGRGGLMMLRFGQLFNPNSVPSSGSS